MSDQDPTILQTEPISDDVQRSTASAANRKTYESGASVLLKVKHLHGYHATVIHSEHETHTVRINEGNLGGVVAQFSFEELKPLSSASLLKLHQNERLDWDYKD